MEMAYLMKDLNMNLSVRVPVISFNFDNHPDLVELRKMNAEAEEMIRQTKEYFNNK